MDADLCLGDNLILFRCFAKTSNFQSKFATINSNFEKNNYLDMHYCITYMYINFQQTLVSRSVQTVHTTIFANNRNLHKFATTNSNLKKKKLFRHASSYNVYVSIFSKIGLVYVDHSKTVHTIYLQKIVSCINLQLLIVMFKKSTRFC